MAHNSIDLIMLDRDGVINVDLPHGVHACAHFELIPNAAQAIKLINDAGIPVVIITNQALVGRNEITLDQLDGIHQYMKQLLQVHGAFIDKIYHCIDTTIEPQCRRKPAPGMLIEALHDFGVNCQNAVMIGDALRDLQAAKEAGCHRGLVRTGKGKLLGDDDLWLLQPLQIYDDLWHAVQSLIHNTVS